MKNKQTNALKILINILIWVFIFILPFLMFWNDENLNWTQFGYHHAITICTSALIFYLNYFVLTEKYLLNKKTWTFILINLSLLLFVGYIICLLKDFNIDAGRPMPDKQYFFYFREVFSLAVVAGIATMVRVLNKWFTTESQRQEEVQRRKEAELINLRQQINPHFFFNTLNNIYALIAISPEKAQNTVLELSKLMRYVLYDNTNNYVRVYKEIDFIKNYIELMRIRLTEKVDVQVKIETSDVSDKLIAPMIFISLIENAFKHGVSHTQPSFIHIDIHSEEDRLVCITRNSYFPKNENDRSGSGIGLENLKRRLDILYPHKHIFRTEEKDNVYICELILPLK